MRKLVLTFGLIFVLGSMVASCGTNRSHCNTKNKTRVDMGWM
jgi:hypothetical protein